MKNRVLVILSCVLASVLLLGSCKSDSKTADKKGAEGVEVISENITVDDAINSLEKACKSNDKESALNAYEIMLRILLDKTVESVNAGNYSDESIITEEQEKRLDEISSNCNCISDEEIQAITDRVEAEY